jgi:hypothetical protein
VTDVKWHDDSRMYELAEKLLEATKAGRISWSLTDKEDQFLYAGTNSSVTVELYEDRFEGASVQLCLLNSRGTVVDSLESATTRHEDHEIAAPWNDILYDLYHSARRMAHNVDEAIESMLTDIEQGTPSRPPQLKKTRVDDPWAADPADNGFSDEPPF